LHVNFEQIDCPAGEDCLDQRLDMAVERRDALVVAQAYGFLDLHATQGKSSKKLQQDASTPIVPRDESETSHGCISQKVRLPVDIIRVLVVTDNMKCPQFQSESTCRFSPLINEGGRFWSMMPKV
jgi:hypothetical protein